MVIVYINRFKTILGLTRHLYDFLFLPIKMKIKPIKIEDYTHLYPKSLQPKIVYVNHLDPHKKECMISI